MTFPNQSTIAGNLDLDEGPTLGLAGVIVHAPVHPRVPLRTERFVLGRIDSGACWETGAGTGSRDGRPLPRSSGAACLVEVLVDSGTAVVEVLQDRDPVVPEVLGFVQLDPLADALTGGHHDVIGGTTR